MRDASHGAAAPPANNIDGARVGEMPSTCAAFDCESDILGDNQAEGSLLCSQTVLNADRSYLHFDGNVLPDLPVSQSEFCSVCDDEGGEGVGSICCVGVQCSCTPLLLVLLLLLLLDVLLL